MKDEESRRFRELFSTYNLLISKIAKAKTDDEKKDCESRCESLERELSSLFEDRRLMTSKIGVPAVGDR